MKVLNAFFLLGAALLSAAQPRSAAEPAPLHTVEHVDLTRYAGKWYEIARYPNRFQRNCQSDTSATYTLRKDGKVEVVNTCLEKNGAMKTARGTAKIADKQSNAKLRVTFFWPFYGDYWVVGLDPDYRYAIVGEPKRKYLWILSRVPQMPEEQYRRALEQVQALGYDPARLLKTTHTAPAN